MKSSGKSAPSMPARGRPRGEAKRLVVEQLLEATEQLLRKHSYLDLTEQEIAKVAGVNRAMIHYYFGDKDGLLFDLVSSTTEHVWEKLKTLDTIDPTSPAVTRNILQILVDAYYAKPWVSRIMVAELTRSGSAIERQYKKKFGPQGLGLGYLTRLIGRLIESGIYDRRIDVEYAAMSMMSIVNAPLMLTHLSGKFGPELEEFRKDSWIDHITDLFDRQLRVDRSN